MAEEKNKGWLMSALQWAGPLLLSIFAGYGSAQYAQGQQAQKLATVERDVAGVERRIEEAQAEHANFPTREELKLILDDLKEIKQDVREIRRSLTK